MSDLQKPIARTLDDPPRLFGMAPLEIAACAVSYAILNTILRGVPFSALFSLGTAALAAITLRIVNLTCPPDHALHWLMFMVRPGALPIVPWPRLRKGVLE